MSDKTSGPRKKGLTPGEYARIIRVSKLFTQEELSNHSGLSIAVINLYENSQLNTPSIRKRIFNALDKLTKI